MWIEELPEENKSVIFLSFYQRAVALLTRWGLFRSVFWYTWVNTFPMLIFCTAVLLSPTEGRNSKLLTRWLQMPDEGPSLIWLHGASISLIGRAYGITERREMSGEYWNWNKTEMLDHARLIICWLTLSAGGLLRLRRKTKFVWCSSDLNVKTLLLFIFESSYRQQKRHLMQHILKTKFVLLMQFEFMSPVGRRRSCI